MDEELLESLWLQLADQIRVIRDSRQWIGEGGTWDVYCRNRWSISKSRANLLYKFSKFAAMVRETDLPAPSSPDNVAPILQLTQKRWVDCYRYCVNFNRPESLNAERCKAAIEHAGVSIRRRVPPHVLKSSRVKKCAETLAALEDGEKLVEEIGANGFGDAWDKAVKIVIDADQKRSGVKAGYE